MKTVVSRLETSAGAPGTVTFVGSTAPGGGVTVAVLTSFPVVPAGTVPLTV